MNLGYRIFVVEGNTVTHISQKSFNDFYFRERGTLPKYGGRTILVVVAMYQLENRRPTRVIRMDTQRVRVNADGTIDKEHLTEGLVLAANRISIGHGPASPSDIESSAVVDAKALFDERRWKHRHPELSGPALKNILAAIFGPVNAI